MTNQTADPLARLAAVLEGVDEDAIANATYAFKILEAFHSTPRTSTSDRRQAATEVHMLGRFIHDPAVVASVTLAPLGLAVVKEVLRGREPHEYRGREGVEDWCIEPMPATFDGTEMPAHCAYGNTDPIHSEALRLFMAAIPEVD